MKNNINFKGHDLKIYKGGHHDGIRFEEYKCKNCNMFILINNIIKSYRIGYKYLSEYTQEYDIQDLKNDISCNEVIIKNIIE